MSESKNEIQIPEEEHRGLGKVVRWEVHGFILPNDPKKDEIAESLKGKYKWFPHFASMEARGRCLRMTNPDHPTNKAITDTISFNDIVAQAVMEPPKDPKGLWTITMVFYSKAYEKQQKKSGKKKEVISTVEIIRLKEEKKKRDVVQITHDTAEKARKEMD